MHLPSDPLMLLSFVNTQLRDHYKTLADFCDDAQADRAALEKSLMEVGYQYNPKTNKFE